MKYLQINQISDINCQLLIEMETLAKKGIKFM